MDNTIDLSAEIHDPELADAWTKLLRAWCDLVPTLYFLDSCSVSRIKDELAGRRQAEDRHKNHIGLLRNVDKPQNGVSCLLVMMEKASDQTTMRSLDEMREEALRDITAMGNFFATARVIESEEAIEQYVGLMHGVHPETLGDRYIALLAFASQLGLHQPLEQSARMSVVEKLRAEALRLGMAVGHPVVVTVVAAVYGCKAARKVLNFTQDPARFKASNALGDIQLLQRAKSIFSFAASQGLPYKQARLITDDVNLITLGEVLNITCESSDVPEDGMWHLMGVDPVLSELLPELFDENGVMEQCGEELAKLSRLMFGTSSLQTEVEAKKGDGGN
ncbi:MAG: hypothetical protein ACTHJO_05875 [Rhodanobacter sp.]